MDLGSQLSRLSRYVEYKLFSCPERVFIVSSGIVRGQVSVLRFFSPSSWWDHRVFCQFVGGVTHVTCISSTGLEHPFSVGLAVLG